MKTLSSMGFKHPFVVDGLWVVDARGKLVGECISKEVARALVKTLNQQNQGE